MRRRTYHQRYITDTVKELIGKLKGIAQTSFLIFLCFVSAVGTIDCMGQLEKLPASAADKGKAQQLCNLYQKSWSTNPDSASVSRRQFFTAFPSAFPEFISLYGYRETQNSSVLSQLYYEAKSHIDLLNDLDKIIPQSDYYEKLIQLSQSGYWQADAAGYLQKLIMNKLDQELCCFLWFLKKHTDETIFGFWFFYFDGPAPNKEIPDQLKIIADYDNQIFSAMTDALREVKMKWKDDLHD